jgi:hypothetical protein
LRRNADAGGMEYYSQQFKKIGIHKGLVSIINAVAYSDEYKLIIKNNEALFYTLKSRERLINNMPVQHVVSLGTHCLASFLIKKSGLKRYSTPFDWTYSNPQALIHCIEDNFEKFLDQSYYQQTTSEDGRDSKAAHHKWYQENYGINYTFNHHNPILNDDYNYFKRCTARFQNLMSSNDSKLFIVIARSSNKLESHFDKVAKVIDSKTNNAGSIQICLTPLSTNYGCTQIKKIGNHNNHNLYLFTPSSYEKGVGFENITDDLLIMQLIRDYKLQLKESVENN